MPFILRGHVVGWGWYCIKFWTNTYHPTIHVLEQKSIKWFGNNEVLKTFTQNFNISGIAAVTMWQHKRPGIGNTFSWLFFFYFEHRRLVNPSPAEPRYILLLQIVQIQISWLLQRPNDLDLHCLPFSIWICINNVDQVIWLAENKGIAS